MDWFSGRLEVTTEKGKVIAVVHDISFARAAAWIEENLNGKFAEGALKAIYHPAPTQMEVQ